eukprot:767200-Hanusia_phi.AAC.1
MIAGNENQKHTTKHLQISEFSPRTRQLGRALKDSPPVDFWARACADARGDRREARRALLALGQGHGAGREGWTKRRLRRHFPPSPCTVCNPGEPLSVQAGRGVSGREKEGARRGAGGREGSGRRPCPPWSHYWTPAVLSGSTTTCSATRQPSASLAASTDPLSGSSLLNFVELPRD